MWAATEFSVALSEIHGRHVSSLIRAAELAYEKIGLSFSKALGNTFRQAIAGIFAKKQMETEKMLQGHVQATVARCKASTSKVLVVSQETAYYNLHHLSGLGLIEGRIRGRLVNFQKTKKQPLPGVKLLGEALVKLKHMAEGGKLFEEQQII
jgi:hypothetical protein